MAAAHGKPSIFPEAWKQEIQEAAAAGAAKLNEYLKGKCNEWKTIPINIGITGESGVGKSTFINAIRGITADDEGSAHADVVEGTKEIKPYKHPDNERMVLWDLPGVGTPNFPRDEYLETVKFEKYDFFLILSAGRFRAHDAWLASQICELKRKFYFIRTQIDLEIEKDNMAHPKTHTRKAVLDKIREDCVDNLQKGGFENASVFLINSYSPLDFDFNQLASSLIDEVPENKMEALAFSISVLTGGVLERKVKALRNRKYTISLISAVSGAVPIPVIGALIDAVVVINEIKFYRKQLGLDEKTMQEYAQLLSTEERQLKANLGLQSLELGTDIKTVMQCFSSLALDEVVEKTLPIAIPIVGSLLAAGVSYGFTAHCLKHILELCYSDARKIHEEIMKKVF